MASFPTMVERWRGLVGAAAPEIPTDFLLAWIKKESGGKVGARSSLDERGLFQIHPSSVSTIGLTPNQWALQAGTDETAAKEQIRAGVVHVRQHRTRADGLLKKYGVHWSGSDYWKFVKLGHGLPLAQSKTLELFKAEKNRAPWSWGEFDAAGRKYAAQGKYGGWSTVVPKVLTNANEVGSHAGFSFPYHPLLGVAIGMGVLVVMARRG